MQVNDRARADRDLGEAADEAGLRCPELRVVLGKREDRHVRRTQARQDLLRGKYEDEVKRGRSPGERRPDGHLQAAVGGPSAPHGFYLFEMTNGRKKLTYGADPSAELSTLALRLGEEEMNRVLRDRYTRVPQRHLQSCASELG